MGRVQGISAPALVERDRELGALGDLVSATLEGRGGSAHVLGPAGAGKSALVRALGHTAQLRGARSWLTSAGQLETRVPFGVVRRLLDRPVHHLAPGQRVTLEAGPARLALTHLWGQDSGRVEPPAQGDMLHSLGWLLDELVSTDPLLLVVDDAQWADEESLLFLGSLRERLAELPLAVVVAARDESVDHTPTLSALVANRDAVVLRLEPLSGDGISVLLGEHWPEVPTATVAAVLDITGGNPFLVHALAGALADQNAPVDPQQVHDAVPDSVVDLMVSRLAGLPAAEQSLARAVAVLDAAGLRDAAALAGLDLEVAVAAADHLRRAGLLADGSGLVFRHALLRAAVYAVIGPDTRDAQHRAAARLLAPQDPTHAAAHLLATTGSGDPVAAELLRAVAAEAMAIGAPQSAVALLLRARAEPPAEEHLADLLSDLGLAQMRTFDPACLATLSEALSRTTDPVARAPRALVLAAAYALAGRHEEGALVLDQTLAELAGLDHELSLTVTAAWAAIALLCPPRVAEAQRRLAELVDLPGETAGERLVLMQQLYLAVCANEPAPTIRALIDRVIGDWDTPEQFPESGDWVWPRLFLGRIGEYDAVRRLTDEGLAHAESTGSIVGTIAASFVRALTEHDAGNLAAAELHYRSMLSHHDGGLLIQTLGHAGLAETFVGQGRIDEAHAVLARFPDAPPPGTPSTAAALVWKANASVAKAIGDHARALQAARGLQALLADLDADSPSWVAWRPLAIEPLRSLGRLDEAHDLAIEHLRLCEVSGVAHLIGEALCLAATVTIETDEAIGLAVRGVALLEPTGSRGRAGTGSLILGSLLRRTGNKASAREHLRHAVETLDRCGASPAAEFARNELAATGVRISHTGPWRLTPSETRVARLALAGLNNREIAAHLHVTRKTVETHLSSVYRKLTITRREQLTQEQLS
jgi:DNA-binding CsgD family transcriptional regulator